MVLDASVLLDVLLRTPRAAFGETRIAAGGSRLQGPQLLDLEVLSTLRRWEIAGRLPPARARLALLRSRRLPVQLYDMRPLVDRVWSLRANLSIADAFYAALAEQLGEPLLTTDERMAHAVRRHTSVEVLSP
jgi:predicted nucleic acid-binding protein